MLNVFRRCLKATMLVCLPATFSGSLAFSQVVTPLQKQLQRVDFGVSGVAVFTNTATGVVIPALSTNTGSTLAQTPSNTVGALVTLRYTLKPYLGIEGNFGYARYTENFSTTKSACVNTSPDPLHPSCTDINIGLQTNALEYTLGYLVHPPEVFGLKTFASVGLGSTAFRPTIGGGLGIPAQARMTYYYSGGVEKELSEHFGVRATFRQAFYLAPDFGQNYLTIKQRMITTEPGVGFYIHF